MEKQLRIVLPSLMLAMLLAMLDNMIVGTAMPRIVGELGGLAHLSWVVTAYILGTTVSTLIWGKLGDLYGRQGIFLGSIVLFLIGSALSGMSQDMVQLIGFRAVQGLGAGGLVVGVMAIIGDLVPPRERGQYQGMLAGIMAIAMVGGPLIGGFITDHLSWRWAFYVNLPLGGLALLILMTQLHLPKYRTEHRIDWLGAGLMAVGITAIVLVTTWGGTQYAWRSAQIIGLSVLAVLALAAFAVVERRAAEPVLSLKLFTNRNFALVSGIGFVVGFALFGAVTFLPLYQQTVQGASATNSGLLLLPLMAGMLLLAQLSFDTSKTASALYMVVLGLGMGCLMQTTILIAQNSVEPRDLGVASSGATFFRSIGGSFGVSLFGAIFANRLTHEVAARLGPEAASRLSGRGGGGGRLDPATLKLLPAPVRDGFLHGVAYAISGVFVWSVLFAIVVPILASFIKEIPLRGRPDTAQVVKEDSTLVSVD